MNQRSQSFEMLRARNRTRRAHKVYLFEAEKRFLASLSAKGSVSEGVGVLVRDAWEARGGQFYKLLDIPKIRRAIS
jgi:hypothetical protein